MKKIATSSFLLLSGFALVTLHACSQTPTTSSPAPTATLAELPQPTDSPRPTPSPPPTLTFFEDFEQDLGGQAIDQTRWNYDVNAPITAERAGGWLQLSGTGGDQGGKFWLGPIQYSNVPLSDIGVFEAKLMVSADHTGGWVDLTMDIGADVGGGQWRGVTCRVGADERRLPLAECQVQGATVEYSIASAITYEKWHVLRIEVDAAAPKLFFFLDREYWGSYVPDDPVWRSPEARFTPGIGAFRSAGAFATTYLDDVSIGNTQDLSLVALEAESAAGTTTAVIRVPQDYPSIQRAIEASRAGDTVLVARGTYFENVNFYSHNITVKSEEGPEVTIVDGGQRGSVVTFEGGETSAAVLDGFTITNGLPYDFPFGGGILIRNASPTIANNIITRNGGMNGGGIYIEGDKAAPIVRDNLVSNNIATERGGGLEIRDGSCPVIRNNVIRDNIAMEGAGIEVANGASPKIEENTITENWAGADLGFPDHAEQHLSGTDIAKDPRLEIRPNFGAGILVINNSSPDIETNIIADNFGGGIAVVLESSPTIQNNTISNNLGEGLGGGILVAQHSSPQIVTNKINGNRAGWGGGIQVYGVSSPLIQDNTIESNVAEIGGGGLYVLGYSSPVVVGNTFEGNQAIVDGGAIWVDRTSSIADKEGNPVDLNGFFPVSPSADDNFGSGSAYVEPSPPSWDKQASSRTLLVPGEHPSIQAAIEAAKHGDTVVVAPGIYRENINFWGKEIVLRSEKPDDNEIIESTIIEAIAASPTVAFENGEGVETVLEGFTILNSLGHRAIYIANSSPVIANNIIRDSTGGAIHCSRACSATIKENLIENNTADSSGGGIEIWLSSPIIEDNIIAGNRAGGAAGLLAWMSSPTILNNKVLNNSTGQYAENESFGSGGGIMLDHFSVAEVKGNLIQGNTAGNAGGGIDVDSSGGLIDSNIIIGNHAAGGGGMLLFLDNSTVISNNVITENWANDYCGGGICAYFSSPTIVNNTIADNMGDAPYACSGIGASANSTLIITNTILWNEGDDICRDDFSEVNATYSNIQDGWPGESNISQAPLFVGNGNYHLQQGSPGTDAGTSTSVSIDMDGDTRPQGAGFDIGADEYVSPP